MECKDVGILAMDMYFPPTCVQQVTFSTRAVLFLSPPPARFLAVVRRRVSRAWLIWGSERRTVQITDDLGISG
jgi:hypothetical protein